MKSWSLVQNCPIVSVSIIKIRHFNHKYVKTAKIGKKSEISLPFPQLPHFKNLPLFNHILDWYEILGSGRKMSILTFKIGVNFLSQHFPWFRGKKPQKK